MQISTEVISNISLEEYERIFCYLTDYNCENNLRFPILNIDTAERMKIEEDNMRRTSICFLNKDINMRILYLNYRRCVEKLNKIIQINSEIRDKIVANIIKFEDEIYQLFRSNALSSDPLIDLFDKYKLTFKDIKFFVQIGSYKYVGTFSIWVEFLNGHSKKLKDKSYNYNSPSANEKFEMFVNLRKKYSQFFSRCNFQFDSITYCDKDTD